MKNARCLVLDGANLGSCIAMQTLCGVHSRSKLEVVVPNSCTETYLAIHKMDLCLAFHGSLRAYLDENAAVRQRQHPAARLKGDAKAPQLAQHFRPSENLTFGLAYFDYCSTLYAGYEDIEKSPIEDIRALFRTGTLDSDGAVLAVTLALPPNPPSPPYGTGSKDAAAAAAGGSSSSSTPGSGGRRQRLHGRHGKDAAGQERDLFGLVAEAAADSQRVAVLTKDFKYERTSIYLFVCYHAAEGAGVAACRKKGAPLSVAEAVALASSAEGDDHVSPPAALSLLQYFLK